MAEKEFKLKDHMKIISGTDIFQRKQDIVMREIAGERLIIPISGDLAEMDRIFSKLMC